MNRGIVAAAVACVASLCASAGSITVESWDADVASALAHPVRMYAGETITLAARLVSAGAPVGIGGATADFLWQTNGMASTWWERPAIVTGSVVMVDVTPAMMPFPAPSIRFFFRVTAEGASYRANGTISLLRSPGARPNKVPVPVPTLDFATTAWTNAPWVLVEADPRFRAWATDTSVAVGTNSAARGGNTIAVGTGAAADAEKSIAVGDHALVTTCGAVAIGSGAYSAGYESTSVGPEAASEGIESIAIGKAAYAIGNGGIAVGKYARALNDDTIVIGRNAEANAPGAIIIGSISDISNDDVRITNSIPDTFQVGEYTLLDLGNGLIPKPRLPDLSTDIDASIAAWTSTNRLYFNGEMLVGDISEQGVAATSGDNYHLVTNCFAIMDDNGRSTMYAADQIMQSDDYGESYREYLLPSQVPAGTYRLALTEDLKPYAKVSDLDGAVDSAMSSWTNASLVVDGDTLSIVMQSPAGPTNVWTSGGSRQSEAVQYLKAQVATLSEKIAALEAGGGASLWNSYAADGSKNPEPGYMTMLNRPTTMFASGFSWQTSGAFSVLTQSGSVAFVAEEGGGFRLGPNSTNYFGFVTGGSIVVGAKCDSFRLADTASGKVAEITYPYSSGEFPTLWFSPDLNIDFAAQENIAWVDNANGTCTATAPAAGTKGFWYATTVKEVGDVFRSTMAAELKGGIFGDRSVPAVIYDSTIRITGADGAAYYIPAQSEATRSLQ